MPIFAHHHTLKTGRVMVAFVTDVSTCKRLVCRLSSSKLSAFDVGLHGHGMNVHRMDNDAIP